jgi:hypothetical protein
MKRCENYIHFDLIKTYELKNHEIKVFNRTICQEIAKSLSWHVDVEQASLADFRQISFLIEGSFFSKVQETVVEGLDTISEAFMELFTGDNTSKQVDC